MTRWLLYIMFAVLLGGSLGYGGTWGYILAASYFTTLLLCMFAMGDLERLAGWYMIGRINYDLRQYHKESVNRSAKRYGNEAISDR